MSSEMIVGEVRGLPKRGISEDTCRKYSYQVGVNRAGRNVQIASYRGEDGGVVAQHVRDSDKNFAWIGEAREAGLFGQHLFRDGGRRVVIAEGEIDAISISQAFNNSWPVVSVPNGAQGAKKAVQKALEWLSAFDEIVLYFDADAPGREAAAECAPLFEPGKCKIVGETGAKDANELLLAKGSRAVAVAVYEAKTFRPDGIVTLEEIEDRVLATPEVGRPYPFETLTKATFGRRLGDVIGLGAGSGVGKTDFCTQLIAHDVMKLGITVGVIYLEQNVAETGRRIAGKIAGKRFHVPDGSWAQEELKEAWGKLKATGRLHLYDAFGAMDWDTIKSKIRYMARALGCEHFVLDHLTALAAAEADERKALERIMAELAGLAAELQVVILFVSHLATPESGSHEEGARVSMRQFKGSRAISFWSHAMFGLERDQQKPGTPTVLRVLKERHAGSGTGTTMGLQYDQSSGLLREVDLEQDESMTSSENDHPF